MINLATLTTIIYAIVAVIGILIFFSYKIYKNLLDNMERLMDQVEDFKEDMAEMRGMYEEKIRQKDDEYRILAERLEQSTIEDVMHNVERDVHAQSHLAQQEIKKNFDTLHSEVENVFRAIEKRLQFVEDHCTECRQ